jgi:hypothetical protein
VDEKPLLVAIGPRLHLDRARVFHGRQSIVQARVLIFVRALALRHVDA